MSTTLECLLNKPQFWSSVVGQIPTIYDRCLIANFAPLRLSPSTADVHQLDCCESGHGTNPTYTHYKRLWATLSMYSSEKRT